MSRQRQIHPYLVVVEKEWKEAKKQLSDRETFYEFRKADQSRGGLPTYHGVKYRGRRRWWTNASK